MINGVRAFAIIKQNVKKTGLSRNLLPLRVRSWIGSRWFWRVSVCLFAVQAMFVAVAGRFSMAFDEYYHLGAIQAYAKTWFPWQIQQPSGPAELGALTADPSYLYHYLMSFPYRFIRLFTDSQVSIVITLRLLDVAIVIIGLFAYRMLLLRLGTPRWVSHLILVFVMFLPVAPFLAGQLTYDTLLFTMTAVTLLAVVCLVDAVDRTHKLPLGLTLISVALLMLSSQVKYAFLPIAAAAGVFLGWVIIRQVRSGKLSLPKVWQEWRTAARTGMGVVAILLVLVSGALFVARYGQNLVRYHHPVPACDVVLSNQECRAFNPYERDDNYRKLNSKALLTTQDKLTYPFLWFNQMMRETYFAVGSLEIGYPTGAPLPISYAVGYSVAVVSLVLIVTQARRLWRRGPYEQLLMSVLLLYAAVLFATNLKAFLKTGYPVAIHGRYLLPLFPVIAYLAYRAFQLLPRWFHRHRYQILPIIAAGVLLLTAYGGGITPLIIRSSDNWFWSHAVPVSRALRSAMWPLIVR